MDIKKIYKRHEALVSDKLIGSSNDIINEHLAEFKPGDIIYTAGYAIVKQKDLNGNWVDVSNKSGGSGGGSALDIASTESVIEMVSGVFSDL